MSLHKEKGLPWIAGVLALGLSLFLLRLAPIPDRFENVLETFVSLSGIVVGFLGTALTILLSLEGRRIIRQLKINGIYSQLVGYLLSSIHSGIIIGAISLIGVMLDYHIHPRIAYWFTSFWMGFVVVFCFSTYRVIRLIAELVTPSDSDEED